MKTLFPHTALRKSLAESSVVAVSVFAALAAFCTYSCMYAFRKPFTAATFEGMAIGGVSLKILFVIAQLVGYTLSKFIGIKVVSELKHHHRAAGICLLVLSSGFSWLLLPVVPPGVQLLCLFANGIPLGMVWGLVFSYIEGRRSTEFMGSVLAISFIFSSGFVKSVGKWLMNDFGVSEMWMPAATAAVFTLPLLLCVFLLEQIPPPTADDAALRSVRPPMTGSERKSFLAAFAPGLVLLVITYVLLTVIRDFRDNFAADIWAEQQINSAAIFTDTETPVSLAILACMSAIMFIRSNRHAMLVNHLIVLAGFLLAGTSTWFYLAGQLSVVWWMVLNGTGLYMGYIPFNVVFFERLIAAVRRPANVGFLIYIADAFGYLGSIGVLLAKNFSASQINYTRFFSNALLVTSVLGICFTVLSMIYFHKKISNR